MARTLGYLFIAFLFMGAFGLTGEPVALKSNAVVDLRSKVKLGEKLTYLAKWTGFPAGVLTARVWPSYMKLYGREVFMFELNLETNDFLSTFFPVSSSMKSYTEVANGRSLLFRRKVREGSYRANDRVIYDYLHLDKIGNSSPRMVVQEIGRGSLKQLSVIPLSGNVCDPLSLAWYMRILPLKKKGDSASVLIADRYSTGIVNFKVTDEELIDVPGVGRFECLVVSPEALDFESKQSLIETEGEATFWLEKNTLVLLRAEVQIPIGLAGALLASHENTDLDRYALPIDKPEEK